MASSSSNNNNFVATDGKEELKLPFGYKFHPSEDEVLHYLKRKIFDENLPANIIPTIPNLYGLNPDEIPLSEYKYHMEHQRDDYLIHQWFFFTSKSESEGQISTKDGLWHSVEPPTPVEDREKEDTIIGFISAIHFYRGTVSEENKSNWTIYEHRLNPEAFENSNFDKDTKSKVRNFVACRILKTENLGRS